MKNIQDCNVDDFTKEQLWGAVEALMDIAIIHYTSGVRMQSEAIDYLESIGVAVFAEDLEEL